MTMTAPIEPIDLTPTDAPESFADRPVAVLGLARSGIALARYLHDAGCPGDGLRRPSADELGEPIAALGDRRP